MNHLLRALWLTALLAPGGCRESREPPATSIGYADVAPLLTRACGSCHGASADSQVRLTSHYLTLGCTKSGARLTTPPDAQAPLYAALARPDHEPLLSAAERETLLAWLRAGAPGSPGSVHPAGILDPRSDEWHGKLAARDGWAALRDARADAVCGRCHDGAPARPESVRFALATAPACTSCHAEPAGALACTTCHGDAGQAYPPRDPCYFPSGAGRGLHAEHLTGSRFRAAPLACATCHPAPGADVLAGAHANGTLDVTFDPALAGADAHYDPATRTCQVACHARGGSLPTPGWHAPAQLDCQSCHASPPPAHYAGACGSCHREMGADPSALRAGPLHIDGIVERGLPRGSCAACHGDGREPWPLDALHRLHRDTQVTTPVACEACHEVPATLEAPGHLDGLVTLRFSGRARAAGGEPSYDRDSKVCSNVACHGGALAPPGVPPRWELAGEPRGACDGCHRAPPPPPHVQLPTCEGALCHGGEVAGALPAGLRITPEGRARHVNGLLELGY